MERWLYGFDGLTGSIDLDRLKFSMFNEGAVLVISYVLKDFAQLGKHFETMQVSHNNHTYTFLKCMLESVEYRLSVVEVTYTADSWKINYTPNGKSIE